MSKENSNKNSKVFQKTDFLYRKRALDKALDLAQNIYTKYQSANNKVLSTEANYWLACIYNTKGLYEGDVSKIEKAIQILTQELPQISDESTLFKFHLELAKAYQNNKNTTRATFHRAEAQKWSEEQQLPKEIILTKIEDCKAAIENNLFDQAKTIVEDCQQLIHAHPDVDESLQATIFNLLGRIQIKRQDIVETLKISKAALDISRANTDVENELTALNNLAIVHGIKSEYKEAMEYLMEALSISKRIQYREQIARCQINMGSIYGHLFNHQQALLQYESVVKEQLDLMETGTEVALYNNIGNIYYHLQEINQAETYFQKTYDLAQRSQYQEMEGLSLAQLARTSLAQGHVALALDTALAAKKILDKLGTVNGLQLCLINLGKIYYEMGDLQQAAKYLSKGVVLSKTLQDDLSQIRAYDLLSKVYFKQDKLKQAYKYLQIYTVYREEYSKVQRNRQLLDLEIKYGFQEKQQEIERLQIENRYQALLLEQKSKIETQNAQLLEANTDLKQFASIASHDLKEPLRMIGSFAKLLTVKHQKDFDETSKEYLGFVVDGVERMDKLLQGLMYYATIGKELELTQLVDMQYVVDVCCLHLRGAIQKAKAEIVYTNLPTIRSKNALLIQLFQNLIGNAIKFRTANKNPIIHIKATESETTHVFSVADNGIGIPKRSIGQVFEIFQRLHTPETYEGTGVGLAVCQKIVKRLDGKIWAESTLGEGTTFFVELKKEEVPTSISNLNLKN